MSRLSVLAFVLFLSILPGLAVPAQDGEPAQPAADFFEAVEVDVVNIDVVVTSRSGEPVTGLTADDFVLLEGGEPVDITYFTEIRDGRAGADVDAANGSAGAVITSGAGSAPAAQPVEPRFMIFLFDQRALQGVNRQRFAEAAEEFLEDELRPGDQALVAYADRGLTILQGFTDDRARVRAAFRFVTDLSEGGTMKIYGRRALIGDMARASFGIDASGAIDQSRIDAQARMFGNQIQQKARELYFQTIDSLGAVAVMVDSLAGIPGRKALVYVGEGLPMRPGESLFQALSNKYRNASNDPLAQNPDFESLAYDLSAEFTKVVAMAQDADVAIYPVDVAGRRADLRNDVSYGAPDQLTADVSGGPVYDSKLDLQREQNLRAGMDVLAQGSGGAVLMNSRKYSDFLDGVERDLGNYYSLGYSPDRERDGQLHRIEVELRDGAGPRRAKIRHRHSFRHRTWQQDLEDIARAELRVGDAPNPLRLRVEAGEPEPNGDHWLVPLAVVAPAGSLTLVPRTGGVQGKLDALLVIADAEGNLSPSNSIPSGADFDGEPPQPDEVLMIAGAKIALAPGSTRVAVAIRDGISSQTAVAQLELDLPEIDS